jgi:hypothetical protein
MEQHARAAQLRPQKETLGPLVAWLRATVQDPCGLGHDVPPLTDPGRLVGVPCSLGHDVRLLTDPSRLVGVPCSLGHVVPPLTDPGRLCLRASPRRDSHRRHVARAQQVLAGSGRTRAIRC